MKQTEQSILLLNTYDGTLNHAQIRPKCKKSTVTFKLTYYDDTKQGTVTKAELIFKKVIALSFSINYFDTPIGAELCGFYEIIDEKKNREEKDSCATASTHTIPKIRTTCSITVNPWKKQKRNYTNTTCTSNRPPAVSTIYWQNHMK